MKSLEIDKMKQVNGGAINWGLMAGIGAAASFFIGLIDGWIHPKKCN